MKPFKSSFLFFYAIFSLLLFISIQNVTAQGTKDSLEDYQKLVLQPQNANDLFKAQDYFKSEYDKAIANGDIEIAINHLYYLASIDYKKGEYDTSEAIAVKALGLVNSMKPSSYLEANRKSLYNLLGLMYTEQKNKLKAINLYQSALEISKTTLDSVIIYNNISLVYKNFDDIDNARHEIQNAYKLLPRIKDTLIQALVFDNYGVIESKVNKEDGLTLMNAALQLRVSVNDTSTIYTSYSHLADYYYGINNIEASRKYALMAHDLANKINSASYKNKALSLLTNISEDVYAKAYKTLNDSLYNAEKESLNKYALLKYDYSEHKRKALESQLKEEEQASKTIMAFLGTAFVMLLSLFLFLILKSIHKKEKLQQVYSTEKRISKKVHDEVANDVYHVMTKLQSTADANESVLDDLEDIYNRTRDISKENSAIDVKVNFNALITDLLVSYKSDAVNIITRNSSKIDWDKVSDLKKTTLYRVLQELMTNMRKHSNASLVVLNFKQSQKKIIIDYKDNGVGCTIKKSNGLQNAENRIKSINGTITFESEVNKGFKTQIIV